MWNISEKGLSHEWVKLNKKLVNDWDRSWICARYLKRKRTMEEDTRNASADASRAVDGTIIESTTEARK